MAEQTGTNIGTELAVAVIASGDDAGQTSTTNPTTLANFEALTWSTIGQVISVAERGALAEDLTVAYLVDGITRHRLGTIDYGVFAVTIEPSFANAGQDAVRSRIFGDDPGVDVAVRETDPAGNIRYFNALIANYRYSEASPGTNETVTFEIRANSAFIQDEA